MRMLLPLLLCCAAVAQDDHGPHTSREGARILPLPKADDVFHFAIYGDRTGGPAEGIEVLKQAVHDTNLLDPDLVMTVGDLVQGYNQTPEWLAQMREYKTVMGGLRMAWFPVAGNHDVYYRGPDKPPEEHEKSYEEHFGPLWYAFEHKRCWFVVLYSDEPNPQTGERNFNEPACQRMSPEQLAWLEQTLAKAQGAEHVFVFLHHPRWLGDNYGGDWERVHRVLAAAGNVSAVFAGHIHRMRWDGVRDGIEYFSLATTGGSLAHEVAGAGFLHHLDIVTVRRDRIAIAAVPVGAVLDPRAITGQVSEDVAALERALTLSPSPDLAFAADGAVAQTVEVALRNPIERPIEITLTPRSRDRRFVFEPDHAHARIAGGESYTLRVRVARAACAWDDPNFALPELGLEADYLGEGIRIALPARAAAMPVAPPAFAAGLGVGDDAVLRLESGACLRLDDRHLAQPAGPFTCEGWLRARDLSGRRAFLNKTESSGWGLFVSDGVPAFLVHAGGRYARAQARAPLLEPETWHHVAGVYDGEEVRLYVDGAPVARAAARGELDRNELPLYVGADPDEHGLPGSFFEGEIDDVRLSAGARYREAFAPSRAPAADEATLLLLPMERDLGAWTVDASGHGRHPIRVGGARCTPARAPRAQ